MNSVGVDEFARTVRAEARRLETDADGLERLERQRRAVRMNSWTDRDTGMRRWRNRWDPETAVRLEARLDAQVEAMFHDRLPDGCPTDLLEKQSYLRALALLAMLDGKGVRLGRPEIVVVVDHTGGGGEPVVDWGPDVDLPKQVLDDLFQTAKVHTVVVRNGVVIDAPGELNLGRTTRLANRAQRRALRGLYATCAIPGCCVRYSRTKLHHVIWWEHGGRTDLAKSAAGVRETPPAHPPRRLARRSRTQPPTVDHTPRRTSHDHRPTQTQRRMSAAVLALRAWSRGIEVTRPRGTLARMPWGDDSADARLHGTGIADSVLDLIGNTPLVRLKRTSEIHGIKCVLAMKMETTNPGGSSKDRPALEMIIAAERDGSAEARRHHRRADERQHRCRPGDRRRRNAATSACS